MLAHLKKGRLHRKGAGGVSPFYEVVSQKNLNLTNDGFPKYLSVKMPDCAGP